MNDNREPAFALFRQIMTAAIAGSRESGLNRFDMIRGAAHAVGEFCQGESDAMQAVFFEQLELGFKGGVQGVDAGFSGEGLRKAP